MLDKPAFNDFYHENLSTRSLSVVRQYMEDHKITELAEVKKLLTEDVAICLKNCGKASAREIAKWAGHVHTCDECCGLRRSSTFCPNCGRQLKEPDGGVELLRYIQAQVDRTVGESSSGKMPKHQHEKWKRWLKFVETAIKNKKDSTS